MRRFLLLTLLGVALIAGACGDDDDGGDAEPTTAGSPTAPADETSEPTTAPTEPGETPTEAGEPSETATEPETEEPTASEPAFDGTLDTTNGGGPQQGPTQTLVDVRVGEQPEGYDRIVFEFEGDSLPAYQVEYVVPPVIACGSGLNVELAGTSALQVSLRPAQAHNDAGEVTIPATEIESGYPTILEAEQTCDFEAAVTWAVGVPEQREYRVEELSEPTRLVIDILH